MCRRKGARGREREDSKTNAKRGSARARNEVVGVADRVAHATAPGTRTGYVNSGEMASEQSEAMKQFQELQVRPRAASRPRRARSLLPSYLTFSRRTNERTAPGTNLTVDRSRLTLPSRPGEVRRDHAEAQAARDDDHAEEARQSTGARSRGTSSSPCPRASDATKGSAGRSCARTSPRS